MSREIRNDPDDLLTGDEAGPILSGSVKGTYFSGTAERIERYGCWRIYGPAKVWYRPILVPHQPSLRQGHNVSAFLLRTLAANLKLLIAAVLLAGVAGFVAASLKPKFYTSSAYLRMDENAARSANATMSSPVTLDKVLAKIKVPGSTVEARRRFIDDNRRIVVAPNEIPRTSKFFRLDFTSTDPHVAQQVNSLLIDAWIESTRPPPYRASTILADIDRIELQTKTISDLLERLSKDAPTLIAENSMQGELATPMVALITKRDRTAPPLPRSRNNCSVLPMTSSSGGRICRRSLPRPGAA